MQYRPHPIFFLFSHLPPFGRSNEATKNWFIGTLINCAVLILPITIRYANMCALYAISKWCMRVFFELRSSSKLRQLKIWVHCKIQLKSRWAIQICNEVNFHLDIRCDSDSVAYGFYECHSIQGWNGITRNEILYESIVRLPLEVSDCNVFKANTRIYWIGQTIRATEHLRMHICISIITNLSKMLYYMVNTYWMDEIGMHSRYCNVISFRDDCMLKCTSHIRMVFVENSPKDIHRNHRISYWNCKL